MGRITHLSDVPWFLSAPLVCHDRLLSMIGSRRPRAALRVAAWTAMAMTKTGVYGPTIAEVVELFGSMPPTAAARIARQISVNMFRQRAGSQIVRRRGYEGLFSILERDADEALLVLHRARQPSILVAVHQGPLVAIGATLHQLSIPATFMALAPQCGRPSSLEYISDLETAAQRTAGLQHCMRRLKEGGIIFFMLDGVGEATLPATILGRRYQFQRGAASLARLAGVPLTPATLRWGPTGNMAMSVHAPLSAPDSTANDPRAREQALIDACASWFDAYLRTSPGSIRLHLLRTLLECPPVDGLGGAELAADQSAPKSTTPDRTSSPFR
jgi:lauroyl/myristoyl acyltransferase